MKKYTEQDLAAIKDFMRMTGYDDFKTAQGYIKHVLNDSWFDIEFESALEWETVKEIVEGIFDGKL